MKRILFTLGATLILQGFLSAQAAEPKPKWLAETVTIREARWPDLRSVIQRIGGFTLKIEAQDEESLLILAFHFHNASIEDILTFALSQVGLSFRIVDDKNVQVFKPTTP